jgi:hypothetical protein
MREVKLSLYISPIYNTNIVLYTWIKDLSVYKIKKTLTLGQTM